MKAPHPSEQSVQGFIKLRRGRAVWDILEASPQAYLLLTKIALRARRTTSPVNRHNLAIGQALIGDFEKIGLTEREYRTAKKRLEKWRLATFKGTNKGTVATLLDSEVFDINPESRDEHNDEPQSSGRRIDDDPATTNKNENNEKYREEGKDSVVTDTILNEIQANPAYRELRVRREYAACCAKYGGQKNVPIPRLLNWLNILRAKTERPRKISPQTPPNHAAPDFADWFRQNYSNEGVAVSVAWQTKLYRDEWELQRGAATV